MAAKRRLPEGVFLRGRTYWVRWSAGGKQHQRSTKLRVGHPGAVEAAKALRAKFVQESFDQLHFPGRVDCSLGDAVTAYLEAKQALRSIQTRECILREAGAFFGEDTPVRQITHTKLRAWMVELAAKPGPGGRARGSQTVGNYLSILKATLRFARKAKLTNADPFEDFEFNSRPERRSRIATEEEIERLVEGARATGQTDLADMIVIAVETGMRLAKISTMHWRDVNLKRRVYRIPPTPGGKPTPLKAPLSHTVVKVLEQRERGGYVFPQGATNAISRDFGQLTSRLGIEDLRFHDLRHTAATRLRRGGADIMTIKAILGHKSMAMHEIYHTVDEADMLAAVDKLEG